MAPGESRAIGGTGCLCALKSLTETGTVGKSVAMNKQAFRNPDLTARPLLRPFTSRPRAFRCVLTIGLVSCFAGPLYAQTGARYPFFDQAADQRPGSEVFLKYCAGCHGFDGFARYEFAPSFSMGDRLQKSDSELLHSVLTGRHAMPYWQGKLNVEMYRRAITYLRQMAERYRSGLSPRTGPLPEYHYKFNPVGEDEDYWMYR